MGCFQAQRTIRTRGGHLDGRPATWRPSSPIPPSPYPHERQLSTTNLHSSYVHLQSHEPNALESRRRHGTSQTRGFSGLACTLLDSLFVEKLHSPSPSSLCTFWPLPGAATPCPPRPPSVFFSASLQALSAPSLAQLSPSICLVPGASPSGAPLGTRPGEEFHPPLIIQSRLSLPPTTPPVTSPFTTTPLR
jgi:hypothetical protein